MQPEERTLAEDVCNVYQFELSFLTTLQQWGMIEMMAQDDLSYVPHHQLKKLEQIARLHYELNINLEGIDAIVHLLDQMEQLHTELRTVRARLNIFENHIMTK